MTITLSVPKPARITVEMDIQTLLSLVRSIAHLFLEEQVPEDAADVAVRSAYQLITALFDSGLELPSDLDALCQEAGLVYPIEDTYET